MNGRRIWLDDWRLAPEGWVQCWRAAEAIEMLEHEEVAEISLDYDLDAAGSDDAMTGYGVACRIAELAHDGELPRLKWSVHSDNAYGAAKIRRVMELADKSWAEYEMHDAQRQDVGESA